MVDLGKEIIAGFGDGNEAIAWGALDAGVSYVAHYPGAPVSRVANVFAAAPGVIVNHALNEHVAALAAMGASLCGARSLVVMKHVGLNIAADPLNYAGAIKISGGMVVVVGTDPGARSSTGEEDVHWYAPQFNLPLLEPATAQGVYEAVSSAFDLSERTRLPVLVFVPGRLAYQSSEIRRRAPRPASRPCGFSKDPQTLINVGQKAVSNHRDHIQRMAACSLESHPAISAFERGADFGIVTRGATYAIVHEAVEELQLGGRLQLLNVERTFPLHKADLLSFARGKEKIVVIEDQDGFLETMIKRELFGELACTVQGKDRIPAWGEITYRQVRDFLGAEFAGVAAGPPPLPDVFVPERPGACCEGCPHRPALFAINRALRDSDGVVGGDIGCSSLPPHRTDWLLCMNAGIGISQGIAQVLPQRSLVSTGGDGSLFHAGLLSLQSAVVNGIKLTHILLDNRSVAMTGHQPSPTTAGEIDLRRLLRAIGVPHILEVDAFIPSSMTLALERASALEGVTVIWVRGECALQAEARAGKERRNRKRALSIVSERCQDCRSCYEDLQCPAIVRSAQTGRLTIDTERCRRCGACLDVCPNNAIRLSAMGGGAVSALISAARMLRRLSLRVRA